jgi:hypothetical protein
MAQDREREATEDVVGVDMVNLEARLRYDEGRAVGDRLADLDDDTAKRSFDTVFEEFDERFAAE